MPKNNISHAVKQCFYSKDIPYTVPLQKNASPFAMLMYLQTTITLDRRYRQLNNNFLIKCLTVRTASSETMGHEETQNYYYAPMFAKYENLLRNRVGKSVHLVLA